MRAQHHYWAAKESCPYNCFFVYSYIFLGITISSSLLSPIIINNSHFFIISMLFRNLTLLFFFFFPYYLGNLMSVKSIAKVFMKPIIQSITGMYFYSLFLCFFSAMVDKYVSHASTHEFKLPFNILNDLLFARCD